MSNITNTLLEKIDGREIELRITVTSSGIRAVLVYNQRGADPLVLGNSYRPHKELVDTYTSRDNEIFSNTWKVIYADIQLMHQTLQEIDDVLEDQRRIHKVSVYCSAPFVAQTITTKTYHHDRPTRLQKTAVLADMALVTDANEVIVAETLVGAILNGYPVPLTSFERHVHANAHVSCLTTTATTDLYTLLQETLITDLGISLNELTISSISQYILENQLTSDYTITPEDQMVWYLHTHMSDIFVINNGMVVSHLSIPYGETTLYDQLYEQGIIPGSQDPASILRAYENQVLDSKTHELISNLLKREQQTLVGAVANMIESENPEQSSIENRILFVPQNQLSIADTYTGTRLFRNMGKIISIEDLLVQ